MKNLVKTKKNYNWDESEILLLKVAPFPLLLEKNRILPALRYICLVIFITHAILAQPELSEGSFIRPVSVVHVQILS